MERRIGLSLILSAVLAVGCDRSPDPAAATSGGTPARTSNRQTTQELLDGPFTTMSLEPAGIPATIQTPKRWVLTKADRPEMMRIEGDAPADLVEIGFVNLHIKDEAQRAALAESARRLMGRDSWTAKIPVTRDSNGALVIESVDQSVAGAASSRPTGASTAGSEPAVEWTVTLCVPNHDRFSVCQLRVIGLTRAEFLADRDFLQKVLGSLTYAPPAPDRP